MTEKPGEVGAVFLPVFQKAWNRLGLTDEERDCLAWDLLANPKKGKIVRGTGGARKLRYALGNRGKSAGARIIYADFSEWGRLYFLTVYSKHEKANLSGRECEDLKKLLSHLEQTLQHMSD